MTSAKNEAFVEYAITGIQFDKKIITTSLFMMFEI